MKKIVFESLTEFMDFKQKFQKAIVYYNTIGEMFIIVKSWLVEKLIEDEGFSEEDFKPSFVSSIREVERIRDSLGNPESFYYRYFQMKRQYLVSY